MIKVFYGASWWDCYLHVRDNVSMKQCQKWVLNRIIITSVELQVANPKTTHPQIKLLSTLETCSPKECRAQWSRINNIEVNYFFDARTKVENDWSCVIGCLLNRNRLVLIESKRVLFFRSCNDRKILFVTWSDARLVLIESKRVLFVRSCNDRKIIFVTWSDANLD